MVKILLACYRPGGWGEVAFLLGLLNVRFLGSGFGLSGADGRKAKWVLVFGLDLWCGV